MAKNNNNRDPEKKTRKHLRESRKKAAKAAVKEGLWRQRQELTTNEKTNVNPLFPIVPTRCNQCGEGFGSVMAAATHRSHYGFKHFCPRSILGKPTCGCIFSSKRKLRMHMLYHKAGAPIAAAAAAAADEEGSEEERVMSEEEEDDEMPEEEEDAEEM